MLVLNKWKIQLSLVRNTPQNHLKSSVKATLQLRPLWMPVIVSSRKPRPVRSGKGETGATIPGRYLHPGQARPGKLSVMSGPRWQDGILQTTEEDLVKIMNIKLIKLGKAHSSKKRQRTVVSVTLALGSLSGLEQHGGTAEGGEPQMSAVPALEVSRLAWNSSEDQSHIVGISHFISYILLTYSQNQITTMEKV